LIDNKSRPFNYVSAKAFIGKTKTLIRFGAAQCSSHARPNAAIEKRELERRAATMRRSCQRLASKGLLCGLACVHPDVRIFDPHGECGSKRS